MFHMKEIDKTPEEELREVEIDKLQHVGTLNIIIVFYIHT